MTLESGVVVRQAPRRARERQQGQPGDNAQQHGKERPYDEDLKLDGPLSTFFGQGLYVNLLVLLFVTSLSFYNLKNASIILSSFWSFSGISISMACLIVYGLLHLAVLGLRIKQVEVRIRLAYLSVFLRGVAATFLLLFLDPARHMVVILPLSLLVLVLLAYLGKTPTIAGNLWADYEAELKLWFDLSSQVVNFAFAGLLGTVISYEKQGYSNQLPSTSSRGGRGYMAPDCFLSYSIVLGLLVQLFSTVPTFIFVDGTRRRMAKVYLPIFAYASLMFLVLASVRAAEQILQEWVFIACFIIVIIPVFLFWMEDRNGTNWFEKERALLWLDFKEEQQDYDKADEVYLACFKSFFAALMASNFKYSIEGGTAVVSLSGWFKCCVLLELYGVLSCAVRMVVLSEMPKMKSLPFPRMVWNLSAIATIIITIILIVAVILLHPDEMKNIF